MEEKLEKFVVGFFRNLKCEVRKEGDILVVENVPKSFEEVFGKASPYKFSFGKEVNGVINVTKQGYLLSTISKFLENTGKTSVLRIDFGDEENLIEKLKKRIDFGNLEIFNISKKYKNDFFYRFTFKTFFHYLNESEQVVNEIYVYKDNVINGDLKGYTVIDFKGENVSGEILNKNYKLAVEEVKKNSSSKIEEIGKVLEGKLDEEIKRIEEHYNHLINELGGDLGDKLDKIKRLELELRTCEESEKEKIKSRLDKIRKTLVNVGNDSSKEKIIKEKDFTIKDVMHKYSLNVENKLLNTTVIYYPVYSFVLSLRFGRAFRDFEILFNPLTNEFSKISCESCKSNLSIINICSSGHISCKACLDKCGDCSTLLCGKCMKKSCIGCAKKLCKSCFRLCLACGSYSCQDHYRKDSVTGEERCINCLRACLRCHNLTSEKMFGEAKDGSKVCMKCLGEEKRKGLMKEVFRD